jgi:primosomal protein N' (replication factor Y)
MTQPLVDILLPVPGQGAFTYRIPAHLATRPWREGQRVLVPFGKVARHGVIWNVHSAGGPPGKSLREVLSIDFENEILSGVMRQLMTFMSQYYHAPLGALLKLVLPPGLLKQSRLHYRRLALASEAPPEDQLTLATLTEDGLSLERWEAKARHFIMQRDLKRFEVNGWVEALGDTPEEDGQGMTRWYQWTGKTLPSGTRAVTQDALLSMIQNLDPDPCRRDQLFSAFPRCGAVLDALVHKGCLVTVNKPNWWSPELERQAAQEEKKTLTQEQRRALECVLKDLHHHEAGVFLLKGVTGSGKTEVYLQAIDACLSLGKQALFLVPEIALTPLMQERIEKRFGKNLALLHSAIPRSKRIQEWNKVLSGGARVVLGARSGVFAPLPDLGLIVVDEEHDGSYKQDEGVRYHARDMAVMLGRLSGATVLLGSATPSLETLLNVQQHKYQQLTMVQRATQAPMPDIHLVDLKVAFQQLKRRPLFSEPLIEALRQTLERQEQAILLLNRRGYHAFLLCRKCGHAVNCHQCDVSLTYHQTTGSLHCHYCDEVRSVPDACPFCQGEQITMEFFGEGTQKVAEAVSALFPNSTIGRLDRDVTRKKGQLEATMNGFRRGEISVLVGTQMIAKGHDFHRVTLVGVLNADQGLKIPDFRAAEHTFQLLTQVAGRSGRGDRKGQVIVQTYEPQHYALEMVTQHAFDAFAERELQYRRSMFYPPYSFLIRMVFSHGDREEARRRAKVSAQWFRGMVQAEPRHTVVLGPTECGIHRLKNQFRYQLLLKGDQRGWLHHWVDVFFKNLQEHNDFGFSPLDVWLDVDPIHFMG